MKFQQDILPRYMSHAPLALAFERVLECRIYERMPFAAPVLDLGCGEGLFARMLFAEKIDTGIDPNPRELRRARELGAYAELIQCRGDAVPKPDGSYRTIFSNSVLEHIPDLAPVFKEVHRLLAPGGRFYMTVPAPEFEQYTCMNRLLMGVGLRGLAARYRRFCSARIWRQVHYHSPEEWAALARQAGFDVIEAFAYDPKAVCLLNDFLYPLSVLRVINKKLFNRWVLMPPLRRVLMYPAYLLARRLLRDGERAEKGGLVFVSLTKRGG